MSKDTPLVCPNDDCTSDDIDVIEVRIGQGRSHQLSAFTCSICNTIIGLDQYRIDAPQRYVEIDIQIEADPENSEIRCPSCGCIITPEGTVDYRTSPFTHHSTVPDATNMELCPECRVIIGTRTHGKR